MSKHSNPLGALPVATLKIIAKLAGDAVKARRAELGEIGGEFSVDQTVVLHTEGTVKVSKSTPDAIIAQKAKPWAILAATLEEANKRLMAAGLAGIDLDRVVEVAEGIDPELANKAETAAKRHLAEIKEEVRDFKWGGVAVPSGTIRVLAKEDHREEDAA